MSDILNKSFVILGGFDHEGITTTLESHGLTPIHSNLSRVKPATWFKRCEMLKSLRQDGCLSGALLYIHTTLFLKAADTEYITAFFSILDELKVTKSIIFVFQDNLDGIFGMRHWETRKPMSLRELNRSLQETESEGYRRERIALAIKRLEEANRLKKELSVFTDRLLASGVQIAPFYKRSDVTIGFQEFIEDLDQNVFLRLFVPADRYQSEQLGSLILVIERYMKQVEGTQFAVDSRKSDKGVVYIFKAKDNHNQAFDLQNAFTRFDSFMQACGDDPVEAESILHSMGHSSKEAGRLVSNFSKAYRRLVLDIRHEYESKLLSLKQRFESEMIETDIQFFPTKVSQEGLTSLIPAFSNVGNVSINIGDVSFVNKKNLQTEIHKMINGSIIYNEKDKVLLDLFEKFTDRIETVQLKSDLDQLKDLSVAETSRTTAKQRILTFLRRASSEAGKVAEKVAVSSLSKYIESLMMSGM